ncbi:MAG: aminoglycoside phosphotransferase family protein [Herpetosiphonaceae bacterium]|nr:aminoglycoside phosphotransferase family protein [Herpetosiphonaceae bacterium]
MLTPDIEVMLRELLRHTFGTDVEIASHVIANQRHDYVVLLAHLIHPTLDVSIKLAGPEAPFVQPFDRAAMLHRLVAAQTTIPMAEILAVDTYRTEVPWQYLIKTLIPGQEWAAVRQRMSRNELRYGYEAIGQAVAQLHAIHLPGFGEITATGSLASSGTLLNALVQRAERMITNQRSTEIFLSVLHKHAALFLDVRASSLCHDDLHGHNILFHHQDGQWKLATILDFDKAWAGHHESDLARLDLWTGMTGDGFWPAYEAVYPVASLYRQRRPIYQLLWCLEYGATTPKHLADTRRVYEELGLQG